MRPLAKPLYFFSSSVVNKINGKSATPCESHLTALRPLQSSDLFWVCTLHELLALSFSQTLFFNTLQKTKSEFVPTPIDFCCAENASLNEKLKKRADGR